jgi:DNA-binding NtrC family response regulator
MKNILLIDDDAMEEKLMQVFLKRRYDKDFSLTYVDTLQSGIAQLRQRSFDVVFIDNVLPPYAGPHESYPVIADYIGDTNLIYISAGFSRHDQIGSAAARNYRFVDKLDIKQRIMEGLLDS